MHDDENGNDDKPLQNTSETDMLVEFMDMVRREGISDKKLRKVLDYVERVVSETDWTGPVMCGVRLMPYQGARDGK